MNEFNIKFMEEALALAEKGYKKGEIPIGSVIVNNGKIIAKGYNKKEKSQNSLCHAEIIAINKACKKLKSWRLENCDIYVTLEPCIMCMGAILNSRIKNLYFGAYDKRRKDTDFRSLSLAGNNGLNHNLNIVGGIKEKECVKYISDFFIKKR